MYNQSDLLRDALRSSVVTAGLELWMAELTGAPLGVTNSLER